MNNIESVLKFNLITGNEGRHRVSENTIIEFENAIMESNQFNKGKKNYYYVSRIFFRFWKHVLITHFLQNIFTSIYRFFFFRQKNFLVVLMGPRFPKCFPYCFQKGTKAIYMFDAWPSYYPYIVRFIADFNIDFIFISSNQSAIALNKLIGKENVFWVPEGVNPDDYNFYPNEKKDIDILCFGRKHSLFHEKVVDPLSKKNISYIYSSDGEIIFPDRNSFVDGLARSKISICFPTNITHPERAGGVETMTNRYLQSMVSKCLVLGKAPEELIRLFGYNPVVEVDMDNPADQIIDLLNNFVNYTHLIEKNYNTVVGYHSWKNRLESIKTILN
jgi:hypothetical protein